MKKRHKNFESEYITTSDDVNYQLDGNSSWSVDFWVKYAPPNTAWSRLVQGVAKFTRRVCSYFKRESPV